MVRKTALVLVLLLAASLAACNKNVNEPAEDDGCVLCTGPTSTVCNLAVVPREKTFDYRGGTDQVAITLEPACNWTATSRNADWLMIDGAATGTGRAQLRYVAAERTDVSTTARVGEIEIRTSTQTAIVTITQTPPPAWARCDIDMLPVYLTLPALSPNRSSNIGISATTEITDPATRVKTLRVPDCSYTVRVVSNSPWLDLKETVDPRSNPVPVLNYPGNIDRYHVREGNNLSRSPREAVIEVELRNGRKKQIRIPQAGCVPSAQLACAP